MPEVLHIVLFRWKPDVSSEQLIPVRQALLGLSETIPGILEIRCGENFSQRSKGYQTVLFVRFASRQALEEYLPHPAHRSVVEEYINPIREDSLVVDLEAD